MRGVRCICLPKEPGRRCKNDELDSLRHRTMSKQVLQLLVLCGSACALLLHGQPAARGGVYRRAAPVALTASDADGLLDVDDTSAWLGVESLLDADDQEAGKIETRDSFVTLGGTQVRASTINVAILGSGNFGTAMGVLLAGKGVNVTIVVRKAEVAEAINNEHVNPKSLGGLELPHSIGACVDPAAAFCCADFIFHAVPCQVGRRRAKPNPNHDPKPEPMPKPKPKPKPNRASSRATCWAR